MDYQLIEELLDQYFEGTTSLEEEKQLKHFFTYEEVPEHLQTLQPLFVHLQQSGEEALGADFDQSVLELLEGKQEAKTRRLSINTWMSRAAAIALIAVAGWWYFTPPPTQETAGIDWSKYEVQDPEEAFKLTQMALLKASTELNRGANTAAREVSNLREIGQFFKK